MARAPVNYATIRELSITEIVRLWHEELGIDPLTLERELRMSVLNMAPGRDWRTEGFVDPIPPDEELPPATTRLDRIHIETFCEKQVGWPLPTFWFPPEPAEVRPRGRPSLKAATVQEFEDRVERGETANTISAEARAIFDALRGRGTDGLPEPKTIEGHIRTRFNAVKDRQNL